MNIKIFIYELVRWFYWYPFRIFIQLMPLRTAYQFVEILTPVYYFLAKKKRAAIVRGLVKMHENKLSSGEVENLVYDTLKDSLKMSIDKFYYPNLNKKYCEKNIEYIGLENLDAALKTGRGVILLHGHLGNPHIIMPAIGYKDYKINQLASRNPPEKLKGFLSRIPNLIRHKIYKLDTAYKEKLPVHFIYIDLFLRSPFEALKRNEIIAIGMDGREGVKSVEINFLKHKAIFYTGAMRLILRAKPVVLPTFNTRTKVNTHKIIIEKPMEIEVSGNTKRDILYNIQNFISILEKYIYKYPWQYADAFCLKDPFLIS